MAPRKEDEQPDPGLGPEPPIEDDEDEDRAAILRRRAVFIASAIAGLGLTTASCGEPRPCLDVAQVPTSTVDMGEPQPCLSVPMPQNTGTPTDADAGTIENPDAGGDLDAGVPDAGDAGRNRDAGKPRPIPRPCLKVAPPQPCLDITVPDDP